MSSVVFLRLERSFESEVPVAIHVALIRDKAENNLVRLFVFLSELLIQLNLSFSIA